MLKFSLLFAFFAQSVFASVGDPEIVRIRPGASDAEAVAIIESHLGFSNNALSESYAFEIRETDRSYLTQYKNGDVVILWGIGTSDSDQGMTRQEYHGVWAVMNYLSSKDFRVVMNVRSTAEDVEEALQSDTTSILVYSGHGNKGAFYDFNSQPVPKSIFNTISPSVYQVVLSTCYGTQALANYPLPSGVKFYSWDRLTSAADLVNFLASNYWDVFAGKKL